MSETDWDAYKRQQEYELLDELERQEADNPEDCPHCRMVAVLNEYLHRVEAAGAALADVIAAANAPEFRQERRRVLPRLRRMDRDLKAAWEGAQPVGDAYGLGNTDARAIDRMLN